MGNAAEIALCILRRTNKRGIGAQKCRDKNDGDPRSARTARRNTETGDTGERGLSNRVRATSEQ